MRVNEVMSRDCEAVKASESLRQAAQRMRDRDIGALFVNDDNGQVAGIITDRDIAVRAVAESASPDSQVSEYMSRDVISCYEDDDLEQAARIMEEQQIRRLMVCNHNDEPVGVLAQADLARALGRASLTGEVLREISQPGGVHSQHH
jgi:predicted transcriptional regulator